MDKTAAKVLTQLCAADPNIAKLPIASLELLGVAFVHAYTLAIQDMGQVFGESPGVPAVVREVILLYVKGAVAAFKQSTPASARGLF